MQEGAPAQDAPLDAWLRWLESGARGRVLLGLDRVQEVAQRLALPRRPTLSIAGTNGKGSCAHFAHRLAGRCGLRAALYTSPHLCDFSERIVVGDAPASAACIRDALATVERARGDIPLTYFEHTTLAALTCFAEAEVPLQVLEVGLGGRLDAVNVVDADVAVITSIGLDHVAELGHGLPDIAREKAGIGRAGRPMIIGTPDPAPWLLAAAKGSGAKVQVVPRWEPAAGGQWHIPGMALDLPPPPARGAALRQNMTAAILALQALELPGLGLPEMRAALADCVAAFRLPGRQQRHDGMLLDIAHNAEAVAELVSAIGRAPGEWHIVLGMLADKPIDQVLAALQPCAATLYCATPRNPRALPAADLARRAAAAGLPVAGVFGSVAAAVQAARTQAQDAGRILITGSLYTVSEVLCT